MTWLALLLGIAIGAGGCFAFFVFSYLRNVR